MTWFTVFLIIGFLIFAFVFEWATDRNARASTVKKIKDAHSTVTEDVAAKMLQQNYTSLVNLCLSLPPERQAEATAKFVALTNDLRSHFSNWTEKGFLQMASRISTQARADQDLDRSSAIAKGFAAVWLECQVRKHPIAQLIKGDLDNLLEANASGPETVTNNDHSNIEGGDAPQESRPVAQNASAEMTQTACPHCRHEVSVPLRIRSTIRCPLCLDTFEFGPYMSDEEARRVKARFAELSAKRAAGPDGGAA